MRFFAHDGKDVHGPAVLDELIQLPGFDGDTLVCPVGSENSSDWKPALAYPPFREALLAPAPKLAAPPPSPPPSPPPAAPPPPQPPPTLPCPRCAHANPEDARFCNACAARMDGREERPEPKRAMANAREPDLAFIPSDPLALPSETAPALVALEPVLHSPEIAAPAVQLAPEPALPPVSAPAAPTWRKTLIASFAGAALASGGLGWWLLRPAKHAAPSVADLNLEAPAPITAAAPPAAAAPAAVPPPAASPQPIVPKKEPAVDLNELTKAAPAPKNPAKRARRHRTPKPVPPPDTETLIESHAPNVEPAIPGGTPAGDAPKTVAAPAAQPAEDGGFMLPGVPRRVPPASVTKPKAGAPNAAAPAAPAAETAEDMTTKQVREQFTFCAQLLSQGAYADHFDTCLCAATREAEPYHGRRGYYAANLKKAADAGKLAISATVTGIVLDGAVAKVTADWRSAPTGTPRTEAETWQLEDGLWCRFP